jgi:F-type H+-transporting ATPase subunit b
MQFDWWTLALQTVNFAVLVWLLHRFLYKPVLRMVDARRAEVEKQYGDAHAAEAKAKAALAEIEAERAGIAAERAAALRSAAVQAEEAAAMRRAQVEREAAAVLDQARKSLAAERDEAVAVARRTALDLGMGIARRLLAEVPTALRAEAWLERVEQHLAGLPPAERDEIAKGLNSDGTLRVVTAVSLPEPVMTEWRARLHRALGDRTIIEFDVDPALIAGTELHFPNAILRFSWRSTLASMRAEIEGHDNAH